MDHFDVANVLREIGALLELEGAEAFRVQAYQRGARAVEAVQELGRLVETRRLTELPGIGDGLAAAITELWTTGRSAIRERLVAALPPGALALAPVATLEQIRRLHAALGVTTLAEVEAACRAGRVRGVRGFGERTEARLLERCVAHAARRPAMTLGAALGLGREVAGVLGVEGAGAGVEVVGAARRGEETVEALELLVVTADAEAEARGDEVSARRLAEARGLALLVHRATPAESGWARIAATGPEAHVAVMAARLGGETAFATEAEAYRAAGLHWIPPEVRDDPAWLAAAETGVPIRLVEGGDIRGMIHCHTTWSDGQHTIAEMVRAAEALGMAYVTITDHSPTASYAHGVEVERLRRQWDEIARVQETTPLKILRGAESDILADGALDYPDAILEQLDIVIASIHNRYQQDAAAMTARLVRALSRPVRVVWGHALGRLLLRRAPVLEEAADVERVLEALGASGGLVELNGDPNRMDLAPRWARVAKARGLRFVCSVDAHRASEMGNLGLAVTMARRAGLGAGDVVNTFGVEGFCAAVRPVPRA